MEQNKKRGRGGAASVSVGDEIYGEKSNTGARGSRDAEEYASIVDDFVRLDASIDDGQQPPRRGGSGGKLRGGSAAASSDDSVGDKRLMRSMWGYLNRNMVQQAIDVVESVPSGSEMRTTLVNGLLRSLLRKGALGEFERVIKMMVLTPADLGTDVYYLQLLRHYRLKQAIVLRDRFTSEQLQLQQMFHRDDYVDRLVERTISITGECVDRIGAENMQIGIFKNLLAITAHSLSPAMCMNVFEIFQSRWKYNIDFHDFVTLSFSLKHRAHSLLTRMFLACYKNKLIEMYENGIEDKKKESELGVLDIKADMNLVIHNLMIGCERRLVWDRQMKVAMSSLTFRRRQRNNEFEELMVSMERDELAAKEFKRAREQELGPEEGEKAGSCDKEKNVNGSERHQSTIMNKKAVVNFVNKSLNEKRNFICENFLTRLDPLLMKAGTYGIPDMSYDDASKTAILQPGMARANMDYIREEYINTIECLADVLDIVHSIQNLVASNMKKRGEKFGQWKTEGDRLIKVSTKPGNKDQVFWGSNPECVLSPLTVASLINVSFLTCRLVPNLSVIVETFRAFACPLTAPALSTMCEAMVSNQLHSEMQEVLLSLQPHRHIPETGVQKDGKPYPAYLMFIRRNCPGTAEFFGSVLRFLLSRTYDNVEGKSFQVVDVNVETLCVALAKCLEIGVHRELPRDVLDNLKMLKTTSSEDLTFLVDRVMEENREES
eukprot:Nk52_evm7s2612 gene=Nk52_evmTU7s2612